MNDELNPDWAAVTRAAVARMSPEERAAHVEQARTTLAAEIVGLNPSIEFAQHMRKSAARYWGLEVSDFEGIGPSAPSPVRRVSGWFDWRKWLRR